ncbi:MAG: YgaP-like transmembrane domain [Bacillota bacterium]
MGHLDFKRNLGNTDRVIRLLLGVLLLVLPTWLGITPFWAKVIYVVAAFDIIQALAGY